MKLYTHARQFPHLSGKADAEIRELAHRAMAKRPEYLRIIRARNVVLLMGMIGAIGRLIQLGGWSIGLAMMAVGAVSTFFVLSWNLVWVNTVLFRITRDETLA